MELQVSYRVCPKVQKEGVLWRKESGDWKNSEIDVKSWQAEIQVWNKGFCCCGYYADTMVENKQKSAEYIRHQLDEEKPGKQMTMFGKAGGPF